MFEWLLFGLLTATITVPPASQAIRAQDDRASGSIVIGGDTVALRHVLARKVPAFWDKAKIVTQVLLTAEPVPEDALEDGFALLDAVRAGTVTGVRLEYEDDGRSVTGSMLSSRLAGDISVSRSGSNVRPTVFTASRIEGSFEATNRDVNDTPMQVKVTWSARVQAMPVVAEPTGADSGDGESARLCRRLQDDEGHDTQGGEVPARHGAQRQGHH